MTPKYGGEELRQACDQAIALHQKGDLAEAERGYRQILMGQPGNFTALHLLGVVRLQQERMAEALELIGSALKINPDSVPALLNFGNVLKALGRMDEALAIYGKALDREPANVTILYNCGNLLREMKRFDAALESYDRALAITPDDAELHNNRGSLLQHLRRMEEALASYQRALAIHPDYPSALANLGSVLLASGHTAEGMTVFARHAKLVYGTGSGGRRGDEPAYREKHDREQVDYLRQAGLTGFHLGDGGPLPGPAINARNAQTAAEEWRRNRPQILVLDDFLIPEALIKLRRFCWDSTVWRQNYNEGYLGAMLEHGFACPLLAQIAEELRQVLPTILGEHPLVYLWGFKYDSRFSGVKIHADSAAVNVNFWITPDEANLNPEASGLIVWDAAAPLDWDFRTFNDNEAAARAFLAREGAKKVTIPYRANRAVIFDSDLFHETDTIMFKDGYFNRRINVTLLYGWRK